MCYCSDAYAVREGTDVHVCGDAEDFVMDLQEVVLHLAGAGHASYYTTFPISIRWFLIQIV